MGQTRLFEACESMTSMPKQWRAISDTDAEADVLHNLSCVWCVCGWLWGADAALHTRRLREVGIPVQWRRAVRCAPQRAEAAGHRGVQGPEGLGGQGQGSSKGYLPLRDTTPEKLLKPEYLRNWRKKFLGFVDESTPGIK